MQDFCATAFLLGSNKYRFEKCNKVLQNCVISQECGIVAFVRDINIKINEEKLSSVEISWVRFQPITLKFDSRSQNKVLILLLGLERSLISIIHQIVS